jgi:hypothetical protein
MLKSKMSGGGIMAQTEQKNLFEASFRAYYRVPVAPLEDGEITIPPFYNDIMTVIDNEVIPFLNRKGINAKRVRLNAALAEGHIWSAGWKILQHQDPNYQPNEYKKEVMIVTTLALGEYWTIKDVKLCLIGIDHDEVKAIHLKLKQCFGDYVEFDNDKMLFNIRLKDK